MTAIRSCLPLRPTSASRRFCLNVQHHAQMVRQGDPVRQAHRPAFDDGAEPDAIVQPHCRVVRCRVQVNGPQAKPTRLRHCLGDQSPPGVLTVLLLRDQDVQDVQRFVRNPGKQPFHSVIGCRQLASSAWVSTSIQTGPPVGVQKASLFVIGKKRPESDARSECVEQQRSCTTHFKKTPCRWKGPDTEGTSKRNRGFTIRTVGPLRQLGRCGYRPNSRSNPYQGFTWGLGRRHTQNPNAGAAEHPIRLGTSSGGERLFW
jgi:hypothetical protein